MVNGMNLALGGAMKHTIMSGLLAAMAAVFLAGCNQDLAEFTDNRVTIASNPDYGHWGALDSSGYSVQQALIYAIQDEHLAHAEYQYVNRKFNDPPPFRGIVRSEVMHISALENLFRQQGWSIPPDIGSRYIIEVQTLREADEVGVDAEIANIAMYNRFLSRTDLPSSFRSVFTNLRDASINHQNAFQRQLDGGSGGGGGHGGRGCGGGGGC